MTSLDPNKEVMDKAVLENDPIANAIIESWRPRYEVKTISTDDPALIDGVTFED